MLCQGPSGEGRLLLRTTSAGRYWDRLTDARPGTGFDLLRSAARAVVPEQPHGYVLGDASACAGRAGARASVDAGQTWMALPCLPGLTGCCRWRSPQTARAWCSGGSGDIVTVLKTTDGGRTWAPIG